MSAMNPYNGGQNLFNFLPGGYYNPTGSGNVPGVSNNPQLQGFVNQLMGLLQEGGGLSDAETAWRDQWLREHGHSNLFPQQQPPAAPGPRPPSWYKPPYQPPTAAPQPMPYPGIDQLQIGGPYAPRDPIPSQGDPFRRMQDIINSRGGMGPNFGGASPVGGGIGSFGRQQQSIPGASMGGMMTRSAFPQRGRQQPTASPLTGWANGMLQKLSQQQPQRRPVPPASGFFRNPTWE